MLLTGGLLNATTVLQPQFLQQQLGYTATIAGLSLSGGGLALLVVMPMAGQAVSRFPARNLIAMGFVLFALSYFYTATHISLLISFAFASRMRVFQIVAIPFVFISVTTAAYFGIPPEKNNQVSGLINFVRNIGGSILISLTNALVTERAQWHQDVLSAKTTPAGRNYQQQIDGLRGIFDMSAGKANGLHLAQGQLYSQLQFADASPGLRRCVLCAGDCRHPDGARGLSARAQPARRRAGDDGIRAFWTKATALELAEEVSWMGDPSPQRLKPNLFTTTYVRAKSPYPSKKRTPQGLKARHLLKRLRPD